MIFFFNRNTPFFVTKYYCHQLRFVVTKQITFTISLNLAYRNELEQQFEQQQKTWLPRTSVDN